MISYFPVMDLLDIDFLSPGLDTILEVFVVDLHSDLTRSDLSSV